MEWPLSSLAICTHDSLEEERFGAGMSLSPLTILLTFWVLCPDSYPWTSLVMSDRFHVGLNTSSWIQVHPTPAASALPPKLDLEEIRVAYLRCTGGEVGGVSVRAPKIAPSQVSLWKCWGHTVAKATGDGSTWRLWWNSAFRTDRSRLRCYLLPLPWLSKPSRKHREPETFSPVEIGLSVRLLTLPNRHGTAL